MPLVDRSETLLVVVDTQPGFFAHPKMTDAERVASAATVDRIAWLVGFASLMGVPVVVTEEDAERNGGTEPRVLDQLRADSPVHEKSTFSLTGCDAAMEAVRATRRATVAVVGFETDVCVAQSAVGLRDLGLRAVVVEDCVYSRGEQHHLGLARMTQAGVERNHLKGLVFEWLRTVAYAREMFDTALDRLGPYPSL
jgi:nicotinamidase-related amidase